MDIDKARNHALEIYKEAVEAANPKKCVQDYLSLEDEVLSVNTRTYNLKEFNAFSILFFGLFFIAFLIICKAGFSPALTL